MKIVTISTTVDLFHSFCDIGIRHAATEKNVLDFHHINLYNYGQGKTKRIDDKPFGGGPGMVLKAEPLVEALFAAHSHFQQDLSKEEFLEECRDPNHINTIPVIHFSPRGVKLSQKYVETYAQELSPKGCIILCGAYEGIDQRIIDMCIDKEISIGDYVISNGNLAAMIFIDSILRYIPGILGNESSTHEESFSDALGGNCEYPHYTRPETFMDKHVPDVLLSGHHKNIEKWKKEHIQKPLI
jgi:tRNA (guanine37-N1)-methyltransferase